MQSESTCIEVRHEALVDKLKDKTYRVVFGQQEEEYLEVDETNKEINDEHKLDVKMKYFDESDLDSVPDDEKDLLRIMFDR